MIYTFFVKKGLNVVLISIFSKIAILIPLFLDWTILILISKILTNQLFWQFNMKDTMIY